MDDKEKKKFREDINEKFQDKLNNFKQQLAIRKGFKSYNDYLKGE